MFGNAESMEMTAEVSGVGEVSRYMSLQRWYGWSRALSVVAQSHVSEPTCTNEYCTKTHTVRQLKE